MHKCQIENTEGNMNTLTEILHKAIRITTWHYLDRMKSLNKGQDISTS